MLKRWRWEVVLAIFISLLITLGQLTCSTSDDDDESQMFTPTATHSAPPSPFSTPSPSPQAGVKEGGLDHFN
ncbi:hypothetical protein ACFL27_02495 [candidate division CSSED10-310 bacterium]|uniref:Uncharacterized protein n=1 Tax=candidate division CSSED10-310 bacterium TaxID=2855610 RepID=A0ABV6YS85_UNCC1